MVDERFVSLTVRLRGLGYVEAFLSREVSLGSRGVVRNGEYNYMGHAFFERNRDRA